MDKKAKREKKLLKHHKELCIELGNKVAMYCYKNRILARELAEKASVSTEFIIQLFLGDLGLSISDYISILESLNFKNAKERVLYDGMFENNTINFLLYEHSSFLYSAQLDEFTKEQNFPLEILKKLDAKDYTLSLESYLLLLTTIGYIDHIKNMMIDSEDNIPPKEEKKWQKPSKAGSKKLRDYHNS